MTRWNSEITDGIDYQDLVLVTPASGDVDQLVSGLNAPIDVIDDGNGALLVVSYFGSIWRLTANPQHVPLFGWGALPLAIGLLTLALASALWSRASTARKLAS